MSNTAKNRLFWYVAALICFCAANLYTHARWFVETYQIYDWYSVTRSFPLSEPHHLGAEYHNIATSVVEGRGFANPFYYETGMTSWMPPLPIYALAGAVWIFDNDKTTIALFGIAAQMMACLFVFWAVRKSVKIFGFRMHLVYLVVTVLCFIPFWRWIFKLTHDGAFQMLMTSILLLCIHAKWLENLTGKRILIWGAFGGVLALSSPALAAGFGCVTLFPWKHIPMKPRLLALAISGVMILPWVARNAYTFGQFIPVKSNLYYELYQSQIISEEGLFDSRSISSHPYKPGREQSRQYLEMGEMEFIDSKKEIVLAAIAVNPGAFLERVKTRFFAAFFKYTDQWNKHPSPFMHVIHGFPTVALFFVLFRRRSRTDAALAMLYIATLLPYVIVSYYGRYATGLLPIKIYFSSWALIWLAVDASRIIEKFRYACLKRYWSDTDVFVIDSAQKHQ